jgi:hypothetical protein
MKNYPFYIDREERPSLLQQFEEAMKVVKLIEELKKSDKPKEDKKDDKKPSFAKMYVLLGLGTFAMVPIVMWLHFTLFLDILQKAQHLPK